MNLTKKIIVLKNYFIIKSLHNHHKILTYSLSVRNYSDSSSLTDSKCKSVRDVCGKKPCDFPECRQKPKVGCEVKKTKCSEVKRKEQNNPLELTSPVNEKIDYSSVECPPLKFKNPATCPPVHLSKEVEKERKEAEILLKKKLLPKPPSQPVVLCPCAPPRKLPPGDCPCPPEIQNRIPPSRREMLCCMRNK